MTELAHAEQDAMVVSATSFDLAHGPGTVIEPTDRTFWATTGSFPQEIVLKLGGESRIEALTVRSSNVRRLVVEACTGAAPAGWSRVAEELVDDVEGHLQTANVDVPPGLRATFVKLKM